MLFNRHTLPNLGKAIVEFTRALFRETPIIASTDVIDERRRRCSECVNYDAHRGQCLVCTCFANVKTLLATEKCPVKVWGRQTKFSTGL